MGNFMRISAVALSLGAAFPAVAQTATSTAQQNSAEAGGGAGTISNSGSGVRITAPDTAHMKTTPATPVDGHAGRAEAGGGGH